MHFFHTGFLLLLLTVRSSQWVHCSSKLMATSDAAALPGRSALLPASEFCTQSLDLLKVFALLHSLSCGCLSVPMASAGLSDLWGRSLRRKEQSTQSKSSDCLQIYLYLVNLGKNCRWAISPLWTCESTLQIGIVRWFLKLTYKTKLGFVCCVIVLPSWSCKMENLVLFDDLHVSSIIKNHVESSKRMAKVQCYPFIL